jgi:low temperature requirement protein LtrA
MTEPVATTTEQEKRVSWGVFIDLVFVVAVTRVSVLLGHDHSWGAVIGWQAMLAARDR